VAPDVEVEFDPKLARQGKDPQSERAIEIVLDELKRYPVTHPSRHSFPNYHKPGAKDPAEGK
jgi:tricorn protease